MIMKSFEINKTERLNYSNSNGFVYKPLNEDIFLENKIDEQLIQVNFFFLFNLSLK